MGTSGQSEDTEGERGQLFNVSRNVLYGLVNLKKKCYGQDSKLTGKNILVSVFALIFWSLTLLSALFHLRLRLLKSLLGEREDCVMLSVLQVPTTY